MKRLFVIFLVLMMVLLCSCTKSKKTVETIAPDINLNQLGYRNDDKKIAVLRGENLPDEFRVINAESGEIVYSGELSQPFYNESADEMNRLADFSSVSADGKYYIENDGVGKSCCFDIGDNVYTDAFEKITKMFYMQRCGERLSLRYAGKFRHPACHKELATVYETGEKLDVSGGWHDAGDYGRYTVAGAKAVSDLMLAYMRAPEKFDDTSSIPERKNNFSDILDETRYELEWMMKMQCADGGVYHKVTGKNFPDAVMPHKEKDMLVSPVSTTATGDFAGAMAIASIVYRDIDTAFADKCLEAAELSQSYLEQHSELEYKNIEEITTGEYGDFSDTDERYFAVCALLTATGDSKYADEIKELLKNEMTQEVGWQSVAAYGSYIILNSENVKMLDDDSYDMIYKALSAEADRLSALSDRDGYGVSLDKDGYVWGSNMNVANNAMLLIMMNDIKSDVRYTNAAKAQLDYILGANPMGISYVTATGSASPLHPHHRPSIYKNTAMQGMLVGGPDSRLEDDCAKAQLAGKAPAKCYIDNDASYSTNEITIYWNSPLVFLMSEFL